MKLYVDLKGDRHYIVTEDGEAVYVDDLREDGRDTEYLEQTIESAWRHPITRGRERHAGLSPEPSLEVEVFDSE